MSHGRIPNSLDCGETFHGAWITSCCNGDCFLTDRERSLFWFCPDDVLEIVAKLSSTIRIRRHFCSEANAANEFLIITYLI